MLWATGQPIMPTNWLSPVILLLDAVVAGAIYFLSQLMGYNHSTYLAEFCALYYFVPSLATLFSRPTGPRFQRIRGNCRQYNRRR